MLYSYNFPTNHLIYEERKERGDFCYITSLIVSAERVLEKQEGNDKPELTDLQLIFSSSYLHLGFWQFSVPLN